MKATDPTAFFWKIADPLLADDAITKGTIMGFPCLRVNGEFFASADHRTGDLVVKLPADRVRKLIEEGTGKPFAPAGRAFKEWAAIPGHDTRVWNGLLTEARSFVESMPGK